MILEAARGSLGSATAPILYTSTGYLTARTGKNMYLKSRGDMQISTLYARQHIQLDGMNILDALDTDHTNIRSHSLDLTATDAIGNNTNALDIALDSDGLLTAIATAGSVNIATPDRGLTIGNIQSAGDITLNVKGDILNGRTDDNVMLSGNNFTLTSISGQVGSVSHSIIGDATGEVNINAETGIYYEERNGDLLANTMQSNTGAVDINVADGNGQIDAVSTDGSITVTINGNGVLGAVSATDAATVVIANDGDLGTISTTGTAVVAVGGDTLNIDSADVGTGLFRVAAESGILNIHNLQVKDRLDVAADIIDLPSVIHTGKVNPLHLSLTGNDAGVADRMSLNTSSSVGTVFDKLSVKDMDLGSNSGNIDLTDLKVIDGLTTITLPDYSVVIYDGTPRLFPNAAVQLVGGEAVDVSIRAGSRQIVTNAKIIDYQPQFIINRFSTENSVARLGEKRSAQQTETNSLLIGEQLFSVLRMQRYPDIRFLNVPVRTVSYDPEQLVQTE